MNVIWIDASLSKCSIANRTAHCKHFLSFVVATSNIDVNIIKGNPHPCELHKQSYLCMKEYLMDVPLSLSIVCHSRVADTIGVTRFSKDSTPLICSYSINFMLPIGLMMARFHKRVGENVRWFHKSLNLPNAIAVINAQTT